MEHDSRPSFGDIIETVAKHPKAYLMHGSFGEALAFLDGYANGRGIGVRHRSATVFSPYQSWLAKRLSLSETDDFWQHFILRYGDEESALKNFSTLWHEFEAEYPAAGQEFSQQSQRETHSDKLSEN